MTDNTVLNPGTGGDTVRDKDRSGVKSQIVILDINGGGAEVLSSGDAANGLDVDVTRVQGTVVVDSELPAAAALTDADANPTVPGVGAYGMVWTGSAWRRVISDANGFLRVVPASGVTNFVDAATLTGATAAGLWTHNNTTFDRVRNNTEGTVLASAARTASPSISNMTNYNARGIRLFLNITATPNNAETLTVAIEWVDSVSAAVKALTAFPAITASTLGAAPAAGAREFVFELYPGSIETAAVANHEVQGGSLPRTLHPKVTHSGAGSWTYSIGYGLVL